MKQAGAYTVAYNDVDRAGCEAESATKAMMPSSAGQLHSHRQFKMTHPLYSSAANYPACAPSALASIRPFSLTLSLSHSLLDDRRIERYSLIYTQRQRSRPRQTPQHHDMSSEEDEQARTGGKSHKKRRIGRACDMCRQKKGMLSNKSYSPILLHLFLYLSPM